MDGLVVRFQEWRRYDIEKGEEVVQLQATTNDGTYFADTPYQGPSKLRERREAFKTYVLESMAYRQPPHEVTLG